MSKIAQRIPVKPFLGKYTEMFWPVHPNTMVGDWFDVVGGWIAISFKQNRYHRWNYLGIAPWGALPENAEFNIKAIYYIKDTFPCFLCFVERIPGEATVTYNGFHMDSSGNIVFRSYPSGATVSVGKVSPGDIVLLGTYYKRTSSGIDVYAEMWRFDKSSKSWSQVYQLNKVATETNTSILIKYAAVVEQDGNPGRIAFTMPILVDVLIGGDWLTTLFTKLWNEGVIVDPDTIQFG